jgi:hypothetical protein
MSETVLITRSSKLDRKADRSGRGPLRLFGDHRRHRSRSAFGSRLERIDECAVVAGGHVLGVLDRSDHLADPVDDREDRAHQGSVRLPAAGPDIGQRIFRRVAERLEPRKVEEAAIAFDGVDEAEDGIEP